MHVAMSVGLVVTLKITKARPPGKKLGGPLPSLPRGSYSPAEGGGAWGNIH